MDSLRYWVTGDARRRLPLRPRVDARARAARGRSALELLRHHPPGPGDQPRQAHRRAVGRRRGRLPGRQLPAALGGVERQVPRLRARVLARRRSGTLGELGYRLTGSSDLYASERPAPFASINFVTAHDGFTLARSRLATTTSTTRRTARTTATASNDNHSWNCGAEGATDDPAVNALRARQQRNFLATLLLSQGVPMLCGGDELGRTQRGNNNAYCQDNELSWYDWKLDAHRRTLLEFTRRLIALRRDHPVLHGARAGSRAGRIRGDRGPRHHVVPPRRRGDDRRGLERRGALASSVVPRRPRDRRRRRARQAASSTTSFFLLFNAATEPLPLHAAAAGARRPALERGARHGRSAARDGEAAHRAHGCRRWLARSILRSCA